MPVGESAPQTATCSAYLARLATQQPASGLMRKRARPDYARLTRSQASSPDRQGGGAKRRRAGGRSARQRGQPRRRAGPPELPGRSRELPLLPASVVRVSGTNKCWSVYRAGRAKKFGARPPAVAGKARSNAITSPQARDARRFPFNSGSNAPQSANRQYSIPWRFLRPFQDPTAHSISEQTFAETVEGG